MTGMELTGKAETTQTRRYTSGQAAAQGHTQQSLPTTFLPTPAPHVDQRRIRDFTTTSHLAVSASNQGVSQQVGAIACAAAGQLPGILAGCELPASACWITAAHKTADVSLRCSQWVPGLRGMTQASLLMPSWGSG